MRRSTILSLQRVGSLGGFPGSVHWVGPLGWVPCLGFYMDAGTAAAAAAAAASSAIDIDRMRFIVSTVMFFFGWPLSLLPIKTRPNNMDSMFLELTFCHHPWSPTPSLPLPLSLCPPLTPTLDPSYWK